jgi:hypothetical protein
MSNTLHNDSNHSASRPDNDIPSCDNYLSFVCGTPVTMDKSDNTTIPPVWGFTDLSKEYLPRMEECYGLGFINKEDKTIEKCHYNFLGMCSCFLVFFVAFCNA